MMDDQGGVADLDIGDTVTADPEQSLSMKDGDTFLVFDPWGDLRGGADGMFCDDTRILSRWRLLVGGRRPSKLSFALSRDNAVFTFNGANLALPPVGGRATPRGVIHLERKRCLHEGRLFERVRLTNFGLDEVMLPIAFEYGADFRDMFEVRGMRRERRGVLTPPRLTGRGAVFGYDGLDGTHRTGAVSFSEPPWRHTAERADFMFAVAPGDQLDLHIEAGALEAEPPTRERFTHARSGASRSLQETRDMGAGVAASDGAFDAWLNQSRADVALLTTTLSTGPYPYAGIPWFSTPFGRDGIICAWQMLWLDPSLARGVLSYLASRQATERSGFADAAPGKIMHETRRGEMAALKEVPFGLYYGGVDTTPLFVALAGAYLKRTGDLHLIRRLWPALVAAVRWLDEDGDSNGDGLLDYQRAAESGLANQGWKDSLDSVFHDDGRFAAGPVALVEVQGYAFAAWRAMAFMAERLDEPGAAAWWARSEVMQEAIEARFWMEERGYYALAIDGAGEVCGPLASNAGHLLFVGAAKPDRAAKVTNHLLSPKFDSGWGIRTLAVGAARFNPMSYHNGSVWPHDTALAVFGMALYGERAGPAKILSDMFEVSKTFDMRMPELLCGFVRNANEPPVAYPVACMPQAWAAGSTFMMLQACLGLSIDALQREVRLVRPTLPAGVDQLSLTGLNVAGATVDIDFQRMGGRIAAIPRLGGGPSVAVVIDGDANPLHQRDQIASIRVMRAARARGWSFMISTARRDAPGDVLPPPIIPRLDQTALFADLDGTLAPIEATPQAVGPNAARRRLIDALTRALSGRFAVVSGRGLADLDRVLEDRVPAVGAVHGLVRRNADRGLVATAVDGPALSVALAAIRSFAANEAGLIIEDKGSAVALHYRLAPSKAAACRALARDLAAELALAIQEGDMVVELRAPGPDKGEAIKAFLAEPPFRGFTPVFLGDDFTDESGFEAVQALGGFGVIVGERRPTAAKYALADVAAAGTWLQHAIEAAER